MNIIQVFEQFPTQESCINYLESVRWANGVTCPYCGSSNNYNLNSESRTRHHCNACQKSFSVTVGTIFHDTKLPIQKWFLAITLIINAKKGVSARQLARDLKVNKDTAWRIGMKIREAMKADPELLTGIVEMDETYVGGKPRKTAKKDENGNHKPKNPRGRGTKKTPVVGMVSRGGKVKAQPVTKEQLKFKDLNQLIRDNVNPDDSVLITDEYTGYSKVSNILKHYTINHSFEYANGEIHTNTIEGFWALLKRGIIGQYHKVSAKHLSKYIDEFCYRYNLRKASTDHVFGMTVSRGLFV